MPTLPPGTSPTLALAHPTEAEKQIQFRLNGSEWRGALTLPAYLRREALLSNQQLTRNGGITYWILIDTAVHNALDPSSPHRLPLASCETYRKRALVWREGKVEETIAHGVGSVFCAEHLRKRGYAARMMQEVGKVLETHQVQGGRKCLLSVLFSDIGKEFYRSHGWEPFRSSHISIPGVVSRSGPKGITARPLCEEDLEELCKADERIIRKRLEERTRESNIAVALIPDIETIRWHHAREDFVGQELHGRTPKVKGAMVGTEEGKRVWCYWTRMWYNSDPTQAKGNTLHILRLVVEDGREEDAVDAIAALMALAQREAQEWRMEEVEAWNPSPATVAAARILHPSAEVVDRDTESIASLRWYPPHTGNIAESIDWVANEKHGWC
ncbi:uncharacterized protein EI97DRAFT_433442 [Westerdykella ornata]|uniref:LYC1 C-terminal domain-containing protein n=1 Tax=Westerdykella ornata TaxID=318751 RepID=A0A6A6JH96_WESOR|nr:uncharacterized protein EI97DRAFT_433442 [Westerdykella ornata]KAF2276030.1 hypothetical protein EI97DRAFT_433442 [Westerdykella ornata]